MQHCIMNGILYWYTILYSYISVYIFKTVVSDMLGWLNAVYITYVEVAMCYLSWTLVGIKTDFIFYTFLYRLIRCYRHYLFPITLNCYCFIFITSPHCYSIMLPRCHEDICFKTWNILIKHVEDITTLLNIYIRAL